MKILFIDDDLIFLNKLRIIVEKFFSFHDVDFEINPSKARIAIQQEHYDTVATDLNMPTISVGLDLIKFTRTVSKNTKIVAVTGAKLRKEDELFAIQHNARIISKSVGYESIVNDVFNLDYNQMKKELINKLSDYEDKESKMWINGKEKISINQLILEVITDTDLGKRYVEIYKVYKKL